MDVAIGLGIEEASECWTVCSNTFEDDLVAINNNENGCFCQTDCICMKEEEEETNDFLITQNQIEELPPACG
jgi:hypothetical protein